MRNANNPQGIGVKSAHLKKQFYQQEKDCEKHHQQSNVIKKLNKQVLFVEEKNMQRTEIESHENICLKYSPSEDKLQIRVKKQPRQQNLDLIETTNQKFTLQQDQTIFQSFVEDQTQFFDCNLLFNDSLSFIGRNHLNRSLLEKSSPQLSEGSHSLTKSLQRQFYELQLMVDSSQRNILLSRQDNYRVILQMDEDEIQEDFHKYKEPKSRSQLVFNEQDLFNLQKKYDRFLEIQQRENKLLILNNMREICLGKIYEFRDSYGQFVDWVQKELKIVKQFFYFCQQQIAQTIEFQKSKTKERLQMEIRVELNIEFENKLKNELAQIEEDLIEKEQKWRKDTTERLEEQIRNELQKQYQYLLNRAIKNQRNRQNEIYFQHRQKNDNYFNQNENSLISQISFVSTKNIINQNALKKQKRILEIPYQNDQVKEIPNNDNDRQFESILQQLQLQNESLCEQLLLHQQNTSFLNEQQLQYRQQLRKMQDLQEQMVELKKENVHIRKYLIQIEQQKEAIRKLFETQVQKAKLNQRQYLDDLEEELNAKHRIEMDRVRKEFQNLLKERQQKGFSINSCNLTLADLHNETQRLIQQNKQLMKSEFQQKMNVELEKKDFYIDGLEQKLIILQQSVCKIKQELSQRDLQLKDQSQKQLNSLQVENEFLKEKHSSIEQRYHTINEQKNHLLSQIDTLINENQKLSDELKAQNRQIKTLQQQQILNQEEKLQILNQIQKYNQETNQLHNNICILKQQLTKHQHNYSHSHQHLLAPEIQIPYSSQQSSIIDKVQSNRSNNQLVNQILQNIRIKKSRVNYNSNSQILPHNNSAYHENFDTSNFLIQQGQINLSLISYRDNHCHNTPNTEISNTVQIDHKNMVSPQKTQRTQSPNLSINHLSQSNCFFPVSSPKSPASISVLSKKTTTSQKEKKMSLISLKLQKLRTDIREQIKEISHINEV